MRKQGVFGPSQSVSYNPKDPVMYNPITCPVPYLGQFKNKYIAWEKELVMKMHGNHTLGQMSTFS